MTNAFLCPTHTQPTMPDSPLQDWPPTLTEAQLEALTRLATTYALSHGLVYLPVAPTQPPAPTSTIHAPLALLPAPFPRRLFAHAQRIQRIYNVLYARVAMDEAFLDRVMGEAEGVGRVDEFTGQLWRRWRRLRDEGVPRVCGCAFEVLGTGLTRSAYSRCNWGSFDRIISCTPPGTARDRH